MEWVIQLINTRKLKWQNPYCFFFLSKELGTVNICLRFSLSTIWRMAQLGSWGQWSHVAAQDTRTAAQTNDSVALDQPSHINVRARSQHSGITICGPGGTRMYGSLHVFKWEVWGLKINTDTPLSCCSCPRQFWELIWYAVGHFVSHHSFGPYWSS